MTQHKISEWLNVLPEPYRSQALEEFKNQGWEDRIVNSASDAIAIAFGWTRTNVHESYWDKLWGDLERGNIKTSKFHAPVNTWIPVSELSNYASGIQTKNVIGNSAEKMDFCDYDVINSRFMFFENPEYAITHIMIIQPPKPTDK